MQTVGPWPTWETALQAVKALPDSGWWIERDSGNLVLVKCHKGDVTLTVHKTRRNIHVQGRGLPSQASVKTALEEALAGARKRPRAA